MNIVKKLHKNCKYSCLQHNCYSIPDSFKFSRSVYYQISSKALFLSLHRRETLIHLGWMTYWSRHWRLMSTLVMLKLADKGLPWRITYIHLTSAIEIIQMRRLKERLKPLVNPHLKPDRRREKLRWECKWWKNSGGSYYKPVHRLMPRMLQYALLLLHHIAATIIVQFYLIFQR